MALSRWSRGGSGAAFAPDFGDAGRLLAAEATIVVDSDEVYLLSAAEDALVKIRDGLLDIKRLQQVDDDGLEQWVPTLKAPFPCSRPRSRRARTEVDLGLLGASLAERCRRGHKTRHRSAVDGCQTAER